MVHNLGLNLARKWRSKTFDELIGQELVVRLLKNSLYRNTFFPVYLLAGMRGCGKTSTGRLFAAALNCSNLVNFQQTPQKYSLPCLECPSCVAMAQGQHPDFTEIDAASHTGVDTIRQLIDTVTFVPALGTYKIYLIDEAHMLSKAAFSALLKVLEEPPARVVFMLATTDYHKILDTVRSRCFQLFFNPVAVPCLIKHLAAICAKENLSYTPEGLALVAQESEGSIRDALNIIERIILAFSTITQDHVSQVLGCLSANALFELFGTLVHKTGQELIAHCNRLEAQALNPLVVWKKLVELLRDALYVKHQIVLSSADYTETLNSLVTTCSREQLVTMLEIGTLYEPHFSKTAVPWSVFQVLMLKLHTSLGSTGSSKPAARVLLKPEQPPAPVLATVVKQEQHVGDPRWVRFIESIETLNDYLVAALFKQSRFVSYDTQTSTLNLALAENLTFFQDWLETTKNVWQQPLNNLFEAVVICKLMFIDPPVTPPVPLMQRAQARAAPSAVSAQPQQQERRKYVPSAAGAYPTRAKERLVTQQELQQFTQAQALIALFPGTLSYSTEKDNQ